MSPLKLAFSTGSLDGARNEMFVYLWEYQVRPSSLDEFLTHYSPTGTWVALFRQAPGYISTQLLQDAGDPTRFVTIDTWQSAKLHAEFRQKFNAQFEALDNRCETLTESEVLIGNFESFFDNNTI